MASKSSRWSYLTKVATWNRNFLTNVVDCVMPLRIIIEPVVEGVLSAVAELGAELFGQFFGEALGSSAVQRRRARSTRPSFIRRLFTPSYSDSYCRSFFCMRCPGMAKGKRVKLNCYLYRCQDCGQEWRVLKNKPWVRRERKHLIATQRAL